MPETFVRTFLFIALSSLALFAEGQLQDSALCADIVVEGIPHIDVTKSNAIFLRELVDFSTFKFVEISGLYSRRGYNTVDGRPHFVRTNIGITDEFSPAVYLFYCRSRRRWVVTLEDPTIVSMTSCDERFLLIETQRESQGLVPDEVASPQEPDLSEARRRCAWEHGRYRVVEKVQQPDGSMADSPGPEPNDKVSFWSPDQWPKARWVIINSVLAEAFRLAAKDVTDHVSSAPLSSEALAKVSPRLFDPEFNATGAVHLMCDWLSERLTTCIGFSLVNHGRSILPIEIAAKTSFHQKLHYHRRSYKRVMNDLAMEILLTWRNSRNPSGHHELLSPSVVQEDDLHVFRYKVESSPTELDVFCSDASQVHDSSREMPKENAEVVLAYYYPLRTWMVLMEGMEGQLRVLLVQSSFNETVRVVDSSVDIIGSNTQINNIACPHPLAQRHIAKQLLSISEIAHAVDAEVIQRSFTCRSPLDPPSSIRVEKIETFDRAVPEGDLSPGTHLSICQWSTTQSETLLPVSSMRLPQWWCPTGATSNLTYRGRTPSSNQMLLRPMFSLHEVPDGSSKVWGLYFNTPTRKTTQRIGTLTQRRQSSAIVEFDGILDFEEVDQSILLGCGNSLSHAYGTKMQTIPTEEKFLMQLLGGNEGILYWETVEIPILQVCGEFPTGTHISPDELFSGYFPSNSMQLDLPTSYTNLNEGKLAILYAAFQNTRQDLRLMTSLLSVSVSDSDSVAIFTPRASDALGRPWVDLLCISVWCKVVQIPVSQQTSFSEMDGNVVRPTMEFYEGIRGFLEVYAFVATRSELLHIPDDIVKRRNIVFELEVSIPPSEVVSPDDDTVRCGCIRLHLGTQSTPIQDLESSVNCGGTHYSAFRIQFTAETARAFDLWLDVFDNRTGIALHPPTDATEELRVNALPIRLVDTCITDDHSTFPQAKLPLRISHVKLTRRTTTESDKNDPSSASYEEFRRCSSDRVNMDCSCESAPDGAWCGIHSFCHTGVCHACSEFVEKDLQHPLLFPLRWTFFDGSCYAVLPGELDFFQAEEACRLRGTHLAFVQNLAEKQYVENVIRRRGTTRGVWMGGITPLHKVSQVPSDMDLRFTPIWSSGLRNDMIRYRESVLPFLPEQLGALVTDPARQFCLYLQTKSTNSTDVDWILGSCKSRRIGFCRGVRCLSLTNTRIDITGQRTRVTVNSIKNETSGEPFPISPRNYNLTKLYGGHPPRSFSTTIGSFGLPLPFGFETLKVCMDVDRYKPCGPGIYDPSLLSVSLYLYSSLPKPVSMAPVIVAQFSSSPFHCTTQDITPRTARRWEASISRLLLTTGQCEYVDFISPQVCMSSAYERDTICKFPWLSLPPHLCVQHLGVSTSEISTSLANFSTAFANCQGLGGSIAYPSSLEEASHLFGQQFGRPIWVNARAVVNGIRGVIWQTSEGRDIVLPYGVSVAAGTFPAPVFGGCLFVNDTKFKLGPCSETYAVSCVQDVTLTQTSSVDATESAKETLTFTEEVSHSEIPSTTETSTQSLEISETVSLSESVLTDSLEASASTTLASSSSETLEIQPGNISLLSSQVLQYSDFEDGVVVVFNITGDAFGFDTLSKSSVGVFYIEDTDEEEAQAGVVHRTLLGEPLVAYEDKGIEIHSDLWGEHWGVGMAHTAKEDRFFVRVYVSEDNYMMNLTFGPKRGVVFHHDETVTFDITHPSAFRSGVKPIGLPMKILVQGKEHCDIQCVLLRVGRYASLGIIFIQCLVGGDFTMLLEYQGVNVFIEADCDAEAGTMPFILHPIQIPLGDGPYRYSTAAGTFNSAFLIFFLIVHWMFVWRKTRKYGHSFAGASATVAFPGLQILPLVFFGPGVVIGGIALIVYAPWYLKLCGTLMLLIILGFMLLLFLPVTSPSRFYASYTKGAKLGKADGNDEELVTYLFSVQGAWGAMDEEITFVQRYRYVFEDYKGHVSWFGFYHMAVLLLASVLHSIRARNFSQCVIQSSSMGFLALFHLLMILYYRPYRRRFHNVIGAIVSVCQATGVVLLIASIFFFGYTFPALVVFAVAMFTLVAISIPFIVTRIAQMCKVIPDFPKVEVGNFFSIEAEQQNSDEESACKHATMQKLHGDVTSSALRNTASAIMRPNMTPKDFVPSTEQGRSTLMKEAVRLRAREIAEKNLMKQVKIAIEMFKKDEVLIKEARETGNVPAHLQKRLNAESTTEGLSAQELAQLEQSLHELQAKNVRRAKNLRYISPGVQEVNHPDNFSSQPPLPLTGEYHFGEFFSDEQTSPGLFSHATVNSGSGGTVTTPTRSPRLLGDSIRDSPKAVHQQQLTEFRFGTGPEESESPTLQPTNEWSLKQQARVDEDSDDDDELDNKEYDEELRVVTKVLELQHGTTFLDSCYASSTNRKGKSWEEIRNVTEKKKGEFDEVRVLMQHVIDSKKPINVNLAQDQNRKVKRGQERQRRASSAARLGRLGSSVNLGSSIASISSSSSLPHKRRLRRRSSLSDMLKQRRSSSLGTNEEDESDEEDSFSDISSTRSSPSTLSRKSSLTLSMKNERLMSNLHRESSFTGETPLPEQAGHMARETPAVFAVRKFKQLSPEGKKKLQSDWSEMGDMYDPRSGRLKPSLLDLDTLSQEELQRRFGIKNWVSLREKKFDVTLSDIPIRHTRTDGVEEDDTDEIDAHRGELLTPFREGISGVGERDVSFGNSRLQVDEGYLQTEDDAAGKLPHAQQHCVVEVREGELEKGYTFAEPPNPLLDLSEECNSALRVGTRELREDGRGERGPRELQLPHVGGGRYDPSLWRGLQVEVRPATGGHFQPPPVKRQPAEDHFTAQNTSTAVLEDIEKLIDRKLSKATGGGSSSPQAGTVVIDDDEL